MLRSQHITAFGAVLLLLSFPALAHALGAPISQATEDRWAAMTALRLILPQIYIQALFVCTYKIIDSWIDKTWRSWPWILPPLLLIAPIAITIYHNPHMPFWQLITGYATIYIHPFYTEKYLIAASRGLINNFSDLSWLLILMIGLGMLMLTRWYHHRHRLYRRPDELLFVGMLWTIFWPAYMWLAYSYPPWQFVHLF